MHYKYLRLQVLSIYTTIPGSIWKNAAYLKSLTISFYRSKLNNSLLLSLTIRQLRDITAVTKTFNDFKTSIHLLYRVNLDSVTVYSHLNCNDMLSLNRYTDIGITP